MTTYASSTAVARTLATDRERLVGQMRDVSTSLAGGQECGVAELQRLALACTQLATVLATRIGQAATTVPPFRQELEDRSLRGRIETLPPPPRWPV